MPRHVRKGDRRSQDEGLTTDTQSTSAEPSRLSVLPITFDVAIIVGSQSCGFQCPRALVAPAIWPTGYTDVGTRDLCEASRQMRSAMCLDSPQPCGGTMAMPSIQLWGPSAYRTDGGDEMKMGGAAAAQASRLHIFVIV
ncbi:hypothetical protein Pdw03_4561 [Penicillium digitatum]|uniref:Uncharacterized protein n=1 Tax=Penicillium digitatum TaxID=36651 RepID=A0A7T7BJ56_PENDI|nr:hypothetical protein Pdw03_4561 [Penicillium digitatum]